MRQPHNLGSAGGYGAGLAAAATLLRLDPDRPAAERIWERRGRSEQHTDALVLPSAALIDEDDESAVYVVRDGGVLFWKTKVRSPVRSLGPSPPDQVQIL